ncbi:MAG: biotin/lipoyl-containing protein, partial [Actinomycetota bacterium]
EGIATTIPFHRAFLAHKTFAEGQVYTRFVEDEFLDQLPGLIETLEPPRPRPWAAGARHETSDTRRTVAVEVSGRRYDVTLWSQDARVFRPLERATTHHAAAGAHDEVRAPMQGTILKVLVDEGQEVEAGDLICTLEAMKMENHIIAPREGKVTELHVEAGKTVETNALIAVIE